MSQPSPAYSKLAAALKRAQESTALSNNENVSLPRVTPEPGAESVAPQSWGNMVGDPTSMPVDNRKEDQTLHQGTEARADENKAQYLKRYFALGKKPVRDEPHTDLSYAIKRDMHDASLAAAKEHAKLPIGEQIDKLAEKIPGGLAAGKSDSKYSPAQLRMGTKVEMEHTDDSAKAKEIARDHLEELPDYYSRLKKMEARAETEKLAQPDAVDQGFTRMFQNLGRTFLGQ